MTDSQDFQNLTEQLMFQPPSPPVFKLYYDSDGKVICYTCDNLPGNYIVITPQQYAEGRPDILVKNGIIIYTHKPSHLWVPVKNSKQGMPTSKYDINLVVDTMLEPQVEVDYWVATPYEIRQHATVQTNENNNSRVE